MKETIMFILNQLFFVGNIVFRMAILLVVMYYLVTMPNSNLGVAKYILMFCGMLFVFHPAYERIKHLL